MSPAPRRTDLGNAQRLVDTYSDRIRWVPEWDDWLVWDGTRWARDAGGGAIVRLAATIARSLWQTILDGDPAEARKDAIRWAVLSEGRSRIDAMITLARADHRVVVRPAQLDADPWMLNCPNGTVDLRSGKLLVHNPADLITKTTGVDYRAEADGQLFDDFLGAVQPDPDMRGYLSRLIGHTLVGQVLEHLLPIWHGTGGNGKGTFTELLLATFGDYASTVPASVLLVKDHDRHPTELADLHGLRLVFASETSQTKQLDEATVKTLTGGDTIKARFLYKDFFEFVPSHSVILVTNYEPTVRGTDHGIWRRLRLIPWPVQITAESIDLQLGEKLRKEREAVLVWAVHGCIDWQIGGMGEPVAVTAATDDYRDREDAFGRFLVDRCILSTAGGGLLKVAAKLLRSAYLQWCAEESEEPLRTNDAAAQLRSRGCKPTRTRNFRGWENIGLLTPSEGDT